MIVTLGGRVQGVGFRNFARYKAFMLGIKGYARNTWDGKVDRKSTRLNSSHKDTSRMPSSA